MRLLSASVLALSTLIGCDATTPEDARTPAADATDASAEPSSAPVAEGPAPSASASASAAPKVDAPPPQKTFPLAEFKLPLAIDLPEDAKIEASKSKDNLGGVNVDSKRVNLRVARADARLASVAAAKATLQKLRFHPAKSFVKEEPDLLVYAQDDGRVAFLFLAKVAGVTYACDGDDAATEAELEPSIAACRSIKKAP